MRKCRVPVLAVFFVLVGCSDRDEQAVDEPAPLELTPGNWAADAESAAFADEAGSERARMRCDAEAGELVLITPGAFAEGARQAMMVSVDQSHHGIEGVEQTEGATPTKIARIPATGPLASAILETNFPVTIETDGAPALMVPTDAVLKSFIERCAAQGPSNAPPTENRTEG